jgi:hypothetical protein
MTANRILEGARFGAYKNCVLNAWIGAPRAGQLTVLEEVMREVYAQHPSGIGLLVVVEPGAAMVDSERRKELDAFYGRWMSSLFVVAQVVEGGNLWSVTARSVMTAIRLVQRRSYPTKVFSEVEEGVEWMAPYLVAQSKAEDAASAARGLLEALGQLRAAPKGSSRVA